MIQAMYPLLPAVLVGKFLSLTESVGFFHLSNEQKVSSCRSIHPTILGWRRRAFETEIIELKKRRRKCQGVLNILEAPWAKRDPQKHLDGCSCCRQRDGVSAAENRVWPLCLR